MIRSGNRFLRYYLIEVANRYRDIKLNFENITPKNIVRVPKQFRNINIKEHSIRYIKCHLLRFYQ